MSFSRALIQWHAQHGRHDLPWQRERTPYAVWISEIMLQQTQVATVIPYYVRFVTRFPDVRTLADAPLDAVLHLWSGLGYYARARNLHRAAQRIRDEFDCEFPNEFEQVASLPGIGRSTAGAILALSRNTRHPILDGNVKRVLARYFAVAGSPLERATLERLWQLAAECTPYRQVAVYTQAIMDLGATVCTRGRPRCCDCPLLGSCEAQRTGRQQELPAPKPRRSRARRSVFMLLAQAVDGSVLLQRRPESGVWGGLWCLPEFETEPEAQLFAARMLSPGRATLERMASVTHGFTHFDLVIKPLYLKCRSGAGVMDATLSLWYQPQAPAPVGLAAPIQTLLERLHPDSAVSGRR